MSEFVVTVTGNVATDIRTATTKQGVALASFRLAITPRRFDRDKGWHDAPTSYVTVTCWRTLALHAHASLGKGQPLVVMGRVTVKEWHAKDGARGGTDVEIDAITLGHDLTKGTSMFRKAVKAAQPEPDDREEARESLSASLREVPADRSAEQSREQSPEQSPGQSPQTPPMPAAGTAAASPEEAAAA